MAKKSKSSNRTSAVYDNGSILSRAKAAATATGQTMYGTTRRSFDYLSGPQAPELLRSHRDAAVLGLLGGPVGKELANSIGKSVRDALGGVKNISRNFRSNYRNDVGSSGGGGDFYDNGSGYDDMGDGPSGGGNNNGGSNRGNIKKIEEVYSDPSGKTIKREIKVVKTANGVKRYIKDRSTGARGGNSNITNNYFSNSSFPMSNGQVMGGGPSRSSTSIQNDPQNNRLSKKDLLLVSAMSKGIASKLERNEVKTRKETLSGIINAGLKKIFVDLPIIAVPINIGFMKSNKYAVQLPSIRKYGALGAMVQTLGMLYVALRSTQSETHRLLFSMININKAGFGINVHIKPPHDTETVAEGLFKFGKGISKIGTAGLGMVYRAATKRMGFGPKRGSQEFYDELAKRRGNAMFNPQAADLKDSLGNKAGKFIKGAGGILAPLIAFGLLSHFGAPMLGGLGGILGRLGKFSLPGISRNFGIPGMGAAGATASGLGVMAKHSSTAFDYASMLGLAGIPLMMSRKFIGKKLLNKYENNKYINNRFTRKIFGLNNNNLNSNDDNNNSVNGSTASDTFTELSSFHYDMNNHWNWYKNYLMRNVKQKDEQQLKLLETISDSNSSSLKLNRLEFKESSWFRKVISSQLLMLGLKFAAIGFILNSLLNGNGVVGNMLRYFTGRGDPTKGMLGNIFGGGINGAEHGLITQGLKGVNKGIMRGKKFMTTGLGGDILGGGKRLYAGGKRAIGGAIAGGKSLYGKAAGLFGKGSSGVESLLLGAPLNSADDVVKNIGGDVLEAGVKKFGLASGKNALKAMGGFALKHAGIVGTAIDFGMGIASGEDITTAASSAGGAAVGGALGATLGSVVPGLGTLIGGVVGSIVGDWVGKKFAPEIKGAFKKIGETVMDWINPMINDVKTIFSGIKLDIAKFLLTAATWLGDSFAGLFNMTIGALRGVTDNVLGMLPFGIGDDLKATVDKFLPKGELVYSTSGSFLSNKVNELQAEYDANIQKGVEIDNNIKMRKMMAETDRLKNLPKDRGDGVIVNADGSMQDDTSYTQYQPANSNTGFANAGLPSTSTDFTASGYTKKATNTLQDNSFMTKLNAVANELRIDPNALLSVMLFETGGTLSPSARNSSSGATGLIQFMPSTARDLGTSTDELAAMSAEQQLDYVYKYFKPKTGKLNNIHDVYLAVLNPKNVGSSPSDYMMNGNNVPWTQGTKQYDQNSGLDLNKDGVIQVGEATYKVAAIYDQLTGSSMAQIPDGSSSDSLWGKAKSAYNSAATMYEQGKLQVKNSELYSSGAAAAGQAMSYGKDKAMQISESVKTGYNAAGDYLMNNVDTVSTLLKGATEKYGTIGKEYVTSQKNKLLSTHVPSMEELNSHAIQIQEKYGLPSLEAAKQIVYGVWNDAKNITSTGVDKAMSILPDKETVMKNLDISTMTETAKDELDSVRQYIFSQQNKDAALGLLNDGYNGLKNTMSNMTNVISTTMANTTNQMSKVMGNMNNKNDDSISSVEDLNRAFPNIMNLLIGDL